MASGWQPSSMVREVHYNPPLDAANNLLKKTPCYDECYYLPPRPGLLPQPPPSPSPPGRPPQACSRPTSLSPLREKLGASRYSATHHHTHRWLATQRIGQAGAGKRSCLTPRVHMLAKIEARGRAEVKKFRLGDHWRSRPRKKDAKPPISTK